MNPPSRSGALVWIAATFAALTVLFAVALARLDPPPARPATEPDAVFSAERAKRHLVAVAGRGEPRPVGSDAVGRAREHAEIELSGLGFDTEVQKGMSCAESGACALVRNLVARRPGTKPGAGAVLLMAHLDSVPASAGASDDGLGVATVLETARALTRGPALPRPIVVVLTDGEEAGLLGARFFHARHPLAKTVHAVVNVEARGSRGPSMLFETLGEGDSLARVRAALTYPITSSLFPEAYRRMPNDTDFSVFRGDPAVRAGVNFANVLGIDDYHTGHDAVAVVDLATLQHHGDQALAAARVYATSDVLDAGSGSHGVWFDVLGAFVIAWPGWASLPLAIFAMLLLVSHAFRTKAGVRALLVAPAALVAGMASAALVGLLLRGLGAIPAPWIASPTPAALAGILTAIAVALVVARAVAPRASLAQLHAGVWLGLAVLGVVLAVVAPAACHVLVVPSLVAAVLGAWWRPWSVAASSLVAGVLWLPLVPLLHAAAGILVLPVVVAVPLLLAVTCAPLLALGVARVERRALAATGLAALASGLVACVVPPFTGASPQRVNVVVRREQGTSRVAVLPAWGPFAWGKAPLAMVRALGPGAAPSDLSPGAVASAPEPASPGSVLRVDDLTAETGGGRRRVSVRVVPLGREDVVVLTLPGRAAEITVDGAHGWVRDGRLVVRAVPKDGFRLTVDAEGGAPIEGTLDGLTRGASDSALGQAVVNARPPEATPTQDGDVSIARQDVRW